jgi:hypothetical protein
MNRTAIILWGSESGADDIKNKIQILKRNGYSHIYIVSCGGIKEIGTETGVVRLHSNDTIGSATALRKAFYNMSPLQDGSEKYGALLIYDSAFIDDRIIGRVNQLTTIADVQPIDMFMVTRLTDKAYSKKYNIGFNGYINSSVIAIRGNESLGIIFLCKSAIDQIKRSDKQKISDIIDDMCNSHRKIFSISNGCC